MKKKYPIFLQDDEKSCGVYCVLMVLKYYGYQVEVKEIKEKTRMTQNGTTIRGLIECFKEYQIEAKAYQATLEELKDQVTYPSILFLVYEGIGHFVVLYKRNKDEYLIADPAQGLKTIYEDELKKVYGGYLVCISHVGRVPQIHYSSYSSFIKETFLSFKEQMKKVFFLSFRISLLGYGSSFFFQIFIDYMNRDTPLFVIGVLCFLYGYVEIMKSYFDYKRKEKLLMIQKTMDEENVFSSLMNIFELPYSFFNQQVGQIQGQLLDLYELNQLTVDFIEKGLFDGFMFIFFLIVMLVVNFYMGMIVVIFMCLLLLYSQYRLPHLEQMYKEEIENSYYFQNHILELIKNNFLIRQFLLKQKQRERSYVTFSEYAYHKEKTMHSLFVMQKNETMLISLMYSFVLLIGILQLKEHLSLGQLVMFYMLVNYSVQPFLNLLLIRNEMKRGQLLYEKQKAFECEKKQEKRILKERITSIVIDNVSYSYGYERPLLEHMDFSLNHHTLIKGKTGSGKSTMLKLIMGYDLNYQGDIWINGYELKELDLDSYYQHIVYLNESPTFLNRSLLENLLCDDLKRIENYLKAFGLLSLKDMFFMTLKENGEPLSLGQRQAVALIRALCQNRDVYILDEALSHLDTRLYNKIMRYLLKNDEGKIYIIVNHQNKLVNKEMGCVIIEAGKIKSEG